MQAGSAASHSRTTPICCLGIICYATGTLILAGLFTMTTITFDTLKFVEKLKAAGVPELQAKAESEALQEALGTAEVATKRDIERVESLLREMKAELNGKLTLVQWMLALVVAAEVVPLLGKLF